MEELSQQVILKTSAVGGFKRFLQTSIMKGLVLLQPKFINLTSVAGIFVNTLLIQCRKDDAVG